MMRAPKSPRGLSLLELVIAIAVLSIGTLAAVRGTDQAQRGLGEATPRLLALMVAQNRAEELRAFGANAPLPGSVEMGGRVFTLAVAREGTAGGLIRADITVRTTRGPGAYLVTYLPPGVPEQ